MIAVSVGEAKNRLPYFLHLAENGESIEITRHGKTVALISGHKKSLVLSRKERFYSSLESWRKKYADCLFSNDEVDNIFKRDLSETSDDAVRHPEDFNI